MGRVRERNGKRVKVKDFTKAKHIYMISTVDSLLTWALDGIANVSMFLKLSVGELNFNVLFKTLHTHAVLSLTVEHHHQITAGK